MELKFNSVETIANLNASAAFQVDSGKSSLRARFSRRCCDWWAQGRDKRRTASHC